MKKRVILSGIAVVVLGVVAADLISGGKLIPLPRSENSIAEEFAGINAKLVKAGTAKVTFRAELSQAGVWTGTSAVRFGAEPVWDTSYTSASVGAKDPIPLRRLHVGERKDYFSSPALKPADGRAWMTAAKVNLGTDLTSPLNNVADLTTWLPFLTGVKKPIAVLSETDVLPDVDGAPHEYRFRCDGNTPTCPPQWDTPIDNVFNTGTIGPIYDIWLDDDGLLRRMTVEGTMDYLNGDGTRDLARMKVGSDYKLSFDLGDFGTAVDVQAPPESEISQKYLG